VLANVGNVLQALLGDTTGAEDLQEAVEAEARAILRAAAVPIVGEEEARVGWQPEGLSLRPVPGELAQLGGSSWQSLVWRIGPIEADFLNGEITLIACRLGRQAPLNTRLTALARRAARGGLTPGLIDVDQLRVQVSTPEGGPGSSGS
jgi:2-dehydropantoate 2-reductase